MGNCGSTSRSKTGQLDADQLVDVRAQAYNEVQGMFEAELEALRARSTVLEEVCGLLQAGRSWDEPFEVQMRLPFGLAVSASNIVGEVHSGGNAAKNGDVAPGDLIVEADGTDVRHGRLRLGDALDMSRDWHTLRIERLLPVAEVGAPAGNGEAERREAARLRAELAILRSQHDQLKAGRGHAAYQPSPPRAPPRPLARQVEDATAAVAAALSGRGIEFDGGSWDISNREENHLILADLASALKQSPSVHMRLHGVQCGKSTPSEASRRAFSSSFPGYIIDQHASTAQARVLACRERIVALGIAPERLRVSATTGAERRVDFVVELPQHEVEEPPNPPRSLLPQVALASRGDYARNMSPHLPDYALSAVAAVGMEPALELIAASGEIACLRSGSRFSPLGCKPALSGGLACWELTNMPECLGGQGSDGAPNGVSALSRQGQAGAGPGRVVAREYTHAAWVLWSPDTATWLDKAGRPAPLPRRTLFRGENSSSITVQNGQLGLWVGSERPIASRFRPASPAAAIDPAAGWCLVVAVGRRNGRGLHDGETRFYLGSAGRPPTYVGAADRVATGEEYRHIGWPGAGGPGDSPEGPGCLAAAWAWHAALSEAQITALHSATASAFAGGADRDGGKALARRLKSNAAALGHKREAIVRKGSLSPMEDPRARQPLEDPRMRQPLDDPRTQRDAPRTQRDDPKTQWDDPKTQRDDPRTHWDDPRTQQDDPRTQRDDPRTQQDNPRTQRDDPRTQWDDARTQRDDSRTQRDDPRTQRDDPRARQPPASRLPPPRVAPPARQAAASREEEVRSCTEAVRRYLDTDGDGRRDTGRMIIFKGNSHNIHDGRDNVAILNGIAAILFDHPRARLVVRGETDNAARVDLARQRAKACLDALVAAGVGPERLGSSGAAGALRRVDFVPE